MTATVQATVEPPRKRQGDGYSVDIRVFLATITVAMALSFIAGVGLGPVELPGGGFGPADKAVVETKPETTVRNTYPMVLDLTSEETKKLGDQHLPSGQVRPMCCRLSKRKSSALLRILVKRCTKPN